MIRTLLGICCGPLLLAACVRPVATPPVSASAPSALVEAIWDYADPHDVPAPFQHLVEWHSGTGPVVLLITAGGRRACAISAQEATGVLIHKPYRCRWSAAR